MSVKKYSEILKKAKACQTNVKKEQKLGMSDRWSYYFAKALISPRKDIKAISLTEAPKPKGTSISNQIDKSGYLGVCKRYVAYIEDEDNKKNTLPNYVTYKSYKITPKLLTEILSRILVWYDNHSNTLPEYVNANSKVFTKPSETGNVVFDYFVNKTKYTPKCLDDVCEYVRKYFKYQFYFDDVKSNKQVIDSKSGNCTDLLQFLCNMAVALGYEFKVIHTQCKVSGTGHVYGMFRRKGTSNWFVRDIACIADESRFCIWCEVPNKGNKLAENPSWFMQNINR